MGVDNQSRENGRESVWVVVVPFRLSERVGVDNQSLGSGRESFGLLSYHSDCLNPWV